jgi:hypothetical protein
MTLPAALPMAPYRPRLTRPLGVYELAGWSVKLIGMSASDDLPGEPLLQAALDATGKQLPQPARTPTRSGVAFVIVHTGTEALWADIGWWELDLLYQRLLRADLGSTDLRPVPPDGPLACVWELQAIEHERSAWVEHVLTQPGHPDIDGYLNAAILGS